MTEMTDFHSPLSELLWKVVFYFVKIVKNLKND